VAAPLTVGSLPPVAAAAPFRGHADRGFAAVEHAFDRAFAPACNPLRNLGALAFLLFWILTATGVYVYAGFDTSADGAHASVERLASNAFPLGSFARSLHRYASGALIVVTLLHLAREWSRGRYAHFRRFAWTTGVVALWLVFASGIGGFWLVWDSLAHYSLVATMEWLDVLPVFDGALMRNFVADDAVGDRLFSLLMFLHIGFPLALLAAAWVHVQRLSLPAMLPPRSLAFGTVATLSLLAIVQPVRSGARAELSLVPSGLPLDWFHLGLHAFADATSPAALWWIVGGGTLLLLALPWTSRAARAPRARAAIVDPANCNGCGRCFDDCPYAAVTIEPRTDGRRASRIAVVDGDLCAACGVCAGACPSSTPFRSGVALASGIDLPDLPIDRLRTALEGALAGLSSAAGGVPRIVVFGCRCESGGPRLDSLADSHTATIDLLCAGQLPPSFVEYALRTGADGVLVTGCRDGDCGYRLGNRWTRERMDAQRAPRLRSGVAKERVRIAWSGRGGERDLHAALVAFRSDLARAVPQAPHALPKRVQRTSDESPRPSAHGRAG
jgi:coenzyme F420-reducing hydrogenase delta subunit/ferredoxin